MRIFFMIFALLLALNVRPVSASPDDTVIDVIHVDVGADTEKLIVSLMPKDFKDVQVIRHSYGHAEGNYETRGILTDSNLVKWDGYWDDNQGYSIKTVINGEVAEEGRIVIGSIDYVPFGFSTEEQAMLKAKQIVEVPVFIDLAHQEKARADKKETEEIAKRHKESVEARETFESADYWYGGAKR